MSTKPKTMLYREAVAAVEQRIADALPAIVDGLIARAREGDVKAATYLCDRIMGRLATLGAPPAEDRQLPYSEEDFMSDCEDRDENRSLLGLMLGSGARKGA